ncbi:ABC transporter ATP-binding protein [Specibacter cremeus]|uniref:ABC transporter ATP-binding protein n=1 Tax=Specibacter cremeus TaxID=1629051 RepID=UPI000F79183D|nr:ABC transporter ATP-binding protein [Specibacter cremeus]
MAGINASAAPATVSPGLSIRGLRLEIRNGKSIKTILKGIDVEVPAGRITGLAGESGSGKTMTAMAVCGLLPDGSVTSGDAIFEGQNLLDLSPRRMNALRGRKISMIFQDPTASLHPMISIGGQLTDHMRHHMKYGKAEAHHRAVELLTMVEVPRPEEALRKFPHQFSGGQLQRIAIAIALACNPSVLLADEPTTALDVTVQAGVLRLLRRLCDDLGIAILLVTHDLGVMSALADTIAVMRNGEVVETGNRFQVITSPKHPYTKALIDALPTHEAIMVDDDDE